MTGQPDIAAALAWSGEAARAAANAQAALRGEPVPALLISSEAHLAEAEASPANPYGSSKHGRFDAGSAAEVAAGVEPQTGCQPPHGPDYRCFDCATDAEMAAAIAPHLCPAQWGEPPDTMLCSLPSGHDGNHATAEGVEWGGRWETAEPGDAPVVITRDELLADWRAANPGACSCPAVGLGAKVDPSCPRHGTAAANLGLTGETAGPGDVSP